MANRHTDARLLRRPDHGAIRAHGFNWHVGGVRLTAHSFAWPEEGNDLVTQCAELNRRAVLPAPELLAGRSLREIALGARC
jgi:hypothetical protein